MLSGISIVCFFSSYAVALVLELTRLLFRSRVRWPLILAFAVAGIFAHSVYLYHCAVTAVGAPLSSQRDWYLLAAWALAAIYLFLTCYHPETAFGTFLLPLVLALLGIARYFASNEPFPREPASAVWGSIHVLSLLLAVVAVLVGFATGLMYLQQTGRLKRKSPPREGLRLPSLEWLQRANQRALTLAVAMFGVGLVSGGVLNVIRAPQSRGHLPWADPVVLSTLGTFAWLLGSLVFTWIYRPIRQGSKVAYFTVVSFLVLVIALAVGLFVRTEHAGRVPRSQGAKDSARWSVDRGQ